jgi:dGTPase
MTIREQLEQQEVTLLSPAGCPNIGHAKRLRQEAPCPYRTDFQRDRDRILHCNSFRRLKRKTQVFLSPTGDHYRTRLTHTLEVSQIARTISRALRLNEDLTEAIALGHDLGHSPFGHSGESILNQIYPHGYRHYEQSLRVVDKIEKNGQGLNLTEEVRNGILCHTNKVADTKEGNVVRVADRIAYMNHDIEDAIRAGILDKDALPADVVACLGNTKTKRITTLVGAVIEHGTDTIGMAPEIQAMHDKLHAFLFERVYYNPIAKEEENKAKLLIETLYHYFLTHATMMPTEYQAIAEKEDVPRAVCDYISGMSDGYAVDLYRELFIPKSWE